MRMKKLGNTGLAVSEICLGAMTFSNGEGMWAALGKLDQPTVNDLVKTAFDKGVNFIDTANIYSGGISETMTGRALQALGLPRDQFVLATKVLARMGPGANQVGLSRAHILQSIDDSLKRLQLDHVDIYQIHGRDPATPLEETLDALDSCVKAGKVRYIGLSEADPETIARAHAVHPVSALQSEYSLWSREAEAAILPTLRRLDIGFVA